MKNLNTTRTGIAFLALFIALFSRSQTPEFLEHFDQNNVVVERYDKLELGFVPVAQLSCE